MNNNFYIELLLQTYPIIYITNNNCKRTHTQIAKKSLETAYQILFIIIAILAYSTLYII